MDPTFDVTPRDDTAARNRFESFKLGRPLPPDGVSAAPTKHAHRRSHSRNTSISSFSSFKSTTVNDFSRFSFPASASTPAALAPAISSSPLPSPTSVAHPNPIPPSKRNSHHRRRSSVSTRHESAEMMGMALPDLPTSTSEDNVNLGEKDSIRRRALWALEGKPDVSFSKVEIPDMTTPDVEKPMFDFTSKNILSNFNNSLGGSKRDSFKLLGPSSSSKDQLHTLVEEEEEEEDEELEGDSQEDLTVSSTTTNAIKENLTPTVAVTKATPSKPRPSTLNLKPLSLTPDNLHITPTLPSPTPTPNNPRAGLRSLTLSPSSSVDENSPSDVKQSRRASWTQRPVLNLALERLEKSSRDDEAKGLRRSSISYKRSSSGVTTNITGLPTPEMTPTFGRRYSNASASDRDSIVSLGLGPVPQSAPPMAADDEFFPGQQSSTQTRPLSASEQHFLVKSHNALLARITDLERALTMRRRESSGAFSTSTGGYSRPTSVASSAAGSPPQTHSASTSLSEPNDEMLNLIADLKAERDELKRDVDGWRTRVGDMDSQLTILAKRIENERRDAWVARSRAGLLEIEKDALATKLTAAEHAHAALLEKEVELRAQWEVERQKLVAKEAETQQRMNDVELELERVKEELERVKLAQTEVSIRVETVDPLATPTPRTFDAYTRPSTAAFGVAKHGLGFMSVDSESSMTDVESSDGNSFRLKTVGEESESEHEDNSQYYEDDEEEDNGLAGYEDEEDADISLETSSSFDSDEDMQTTYVHGSVVHNLGMPPSPTTPTSQEVFAPAKSHARRATLSKTWTFPFGAHHQSAAVPQADEEDKQDKFFGCLDDTESEASGSIPSSPSAYSYEKTKSAFASGFKFAGANDNASFFLPGLGFPASDSEQENQGLQVVAEEIEEEESSLDMEETDSDAEDDEDVFEGACGISFTFTPPQEEEVKEEPPQIQITSPTKRTSPPPMLPALDFGLGDDEEEEEEGKGVIPFNFGRPLEERQPSPPAVQVSQSPVAFPTIMTPPSARPASPSRIPAPSSSSSSIPRLVSISPKSVVDTSMSTPTKAAHSPFVTPPTKRGGAMPSFIPQPVSSPSPLRTASATRPKVVVPTSTFIPQPTRKPVPSVEADPRSNSNVPSVMSASMNMSPSASFRRFDNNKIGASQSSAPAPAAYHSVFDYDGERNTRSSPAQMKSVDLSATHDHHHSCTTTGCSGSPCNAIPTSSGLTSPLSFFGSRPSFQTITNFIPKAWASPAPASSSQPSFMPHHQSNLSEQTVVPEQPSPRIEPTALPVSGGYVSREKQLRRLLHRMEVEGKAQMSYSTNPDCRNCTTALVHI